MAGCWECWRTVREKCCHERNDRRKGIENKSGSNGYNWQFVEVVKVVKDSHGDVL